MDPPEKSEELSDVEALRRELKAARIEIAELKASSPPKPEPLTIPHCDDTDHDPFAVTFNTIVIFGAEGNLAMKKTFPALFALMRQRHLPANVVIIGYARDNLTREQFQKLVYRSIYNVAQPNAERLQFLARVWYLQGQFNDQAAFNRLRTEIDAREQEQEAKWRAANGAPLTPPAAASSAFASSSSSSSVVVASFRHVRAFYLAVPPFLYPDIAKGCVRAGLRRSDSAGGSAGNRGACEPRDRFVLEKPFGKDTKSCEALCAAVSQCLSEAQVYRIDHYLGKELVMNVLVMRFANISFNAIWGRSHIHSVHVTCKEAIGTQGRGGYFDQYGIIRDVMQNHLLQILALVGMEQPLSLSAEHIRAEKVKLLQAVQPLALDDLLVGQYTAGVGGVGGGPGKGKPGYTDDHTIADKGTLTETYAAAVLAIHNPRWSGVPFVLKAGKALDESKVEVRIRFHGVPGAIPALQGCPPNELVIRVQPDESIYWKITSKVPGLDFNVETRRMDLLYANPAANATAAQAARVGLSVASAAAAAAAAAAANAGGTGGPAAAPLAAAGGGRLPATGVAAVATAATAASSAAAAATAPAAAAAQGGQALPGAYERLILEVLRGDQTNFVHADELLASWRIFTPVLDELADRAVVPEPYPFGSAGPASERAFAAKFGFPDGFTAAAGGGDAAEGGLDRQSIAWGRGSVAGSAESTGPASSRASSASDLPNVLDPNHNASAAAAASSQRAGGGGAVRSGGRVAPRIVRRSSWLPQPKPRPSAGASSGTKPDSRANEGVEAGLSKQGSPTSTLPSFAAQPPAPPTEGPRQPSGNGGTGGDLP